MGRSRLLSLIGVALVLVVGLAVGISRSERWSHVELERTFDQRATAASQVLSATLDQTLQQMRATDRLAYGTLDVTDAQVRAVQGDREAQIIADPRGRVMAAWPRGTARRGQDLLKGNPAVRAVVRGGRDVAIQTTPAGIAFAIRFDTPFGRRVALGPVPAPIVSGYLSGYLSRVRAGRRDDGFVIGPRGSVLAATPGADPGYARAGTRHPERDGEPMYVARARMAAPAEDWEIVIATPQEELYSATGGLTGALPWILLAGVALLVALVLALVRRLAGNAATVERANAELAQRNVEVVAADRLKGEFLATMSHELRTPLNGIIGFAELMHDGHVGPVSDEHREYLGDILTSSAHLRHLIDDVLDLSKIEAGRIDLRPTRVDAEALVTEVCGTVGALAAERHIALTADVDPAVGPLHLDEGRLRQVLLNYVSNALKFTPEGGSVVVRARPEPGRRVRFTVEDDGPGIAAADAKRLWEAFEQLDSGPARRYGGTGLGLSLTRRIAEAQDGTVSVDERPGGGARFHVVLPAGVVPDEPRFTTEVLR